MPLQPQQASFYSTLLVQVTLSKQIWEAGVDEAGRGPLAGPVVVAAVILPANYDLDSLDDSKRLSALKRERRAAAHHQERCRTGGVVERSPGDIGRPQIAQGVFVGITRSAAVELDDRGRSLTFRAVGAAGITDGRSVGNAGDAD